jgi:integrase
MAGKRFEISTGIFVDEITWQESNQKNKGKTEEAKTIKNRVDKVTAKIQDIYNQLESLGQPFDVFSIKNKFLGLSNGQGFLEIFDMVIGNIEATLEKDYSPLTLKQYRTTRKRFAEFLGGQRMKDIPLANIEYKFLKTFDVYLKKTYHVAPNTAFCYHKILKKVLNTAIAMNHLFRNPYDTYKFFRTDGKRDFLTLQEVREIQSKEITIPRMDQIRDIFVFACFTGLSYVDVSKLSSDHIQKGSDGADWIIIDRSKMDNWCRIPILPATNEILQKYENHPLVCRTNKLLPVPC